MTNEDYKNGKLVEIVREFNHIKGTTRYEINGITQSIAVPFWREEDGKFKVIPKGSYKFINESGNNYLEITDETILQQAFQFQIVYVYSQISSKYVEDFPELSVLTTKYNELVDDATKLFSYLKSVGMISDTFQMTKVLSPLEPMTTWYMDEKREIKALPISELYVKFNLMIEKLKKILADYTESKKEEISGATFFPHLIEDGTLSWTNDKNKPNPEPVNIKGPSGTIENVTASVNSNAGVPSVKVTMSGTKENRSFNLEFQNLKGDKPIKGTDYYTPAEKEQFTTEMVGIVKTEGTKVVEQVKSIVSGNPATTNALTLSGKTRVEFEKDTEKVREELEEKANDNIILINKFDINSLKTGYFDGTGEISTQDGITTNYSEIYIPVKNGTKYVWTKEFYVSSTDNRQIIIATYDINKKFLERILINRLDTNTKTFNSNVAFIRLSFYACETNKKFMFCENELPKTYIPYRHYLNYESVYGLENNINSKINENNLFINEKTDKKIYTFADSIYSPNSEWDNIHEQYYGDDKLGLVGNPLYVTYALKIKRNTKIYFPEPSEIYCSICIYDNAEYKNGKRYRKLGSENTLPTNTLNAVEVREGEYILVTCHKEHRNFSMCMINYVVALNKELLLHNNHIIQVKKEISDLMPKKWKIKYTESPNFAKERKATIDLYIPINKNYLHFELVETYVDSETSSNPNNPTSSSNSNVWKINTASICDNKLNKKFDITTYGEWECAIKLKNKEVDDFMGGDAHGDEVKETIVFIINGKPVDITAFTKLTDIDSFKFIQTSSLYKPDDKATLSTRHQFTPVATHGSEHIFTENGVIINQSVLWHEEVTVVQGYLCMMLNAKDVVDKMYTNADYEVIDLSNKNKYSLEKNNVNKIVQYSDSNNKGVIASVTVNRIKGMNSKGNQGYISVGDNGGNHYHKCYLPLFYNMSGEIVQKNTLWECSSKYEYEFE